MEYIFWISCFLLFFIYIGYGIVIYILLRLKKILVKPVNYAFANDQALPTVGVLICAYNEEEVIRDKILNTLELNYAPGKVKIYVNADGSDDRTVEETKNYPEVILLFKPEREGKSNATNRSMQLIKEEITVFTDANTLLNKDALINITKPYSNPKVGGVCGEKRVVTNLVDNAADTEGVYWKYESLLKKWDAELNSTIGAAGELFSIRTSLYKALPYDDLMSDFIIPANILRKGYKMDYAPDAYAIEAPSRDIVEEFKRKVRISAGGIQTVMRLTDFLNFFRYGLTTFQYVFHRAMRWCLAPELLIIAFITNALLAINSGFYLIIFFCHLFFYFLALLGYILQKQNKTFKLAGIIFYFVFMHWCVLLGTIRYFRGKQSISWVKSERISMGNVVDRNT